MSDKYDDKLLAETIENPGYHESLLKEAFSKDPSEGDLLLWQLFGLHMANGSDCLHASHMLMYGRPLVEEFFGKGSPQLIKLLYWLGWAREQIDDTHGSDSYFRLAMEEIQTTELFSAEEYPELKAKGY